MESKALSSVRQIVVYLNRLNIKVFFQLTLVRMYCDIPVCDEYHWTKGHRLLSFTE